MDSLYSNKKTLLCIKQLYEEKGIIHSYLSAFKCWWFYSPWALLVFRKKSLLVGFACVLAKKLAKVFGRCSLWVKISVQTWSFSTATISEVHCCKDWTKALGHPLGFYRINQTVGMGGCVCFGFIYLFILQVGKLRHRGPAGSMGHLLVLDHFAAIRMFSSFHSHQAVTPVPWFEWCQGEFGLAWLGWGSHVPALGSCRAVHHAPSSDLRSFSRSHCKNESVDLPTQGFGCPGS